MSNASNAGCVTCRARNKKCDKSRGPTGCRRCTRAGIICGGYLGTTPRIPNVKHSVRGNEQRANTNRKSGIVDLNEFPSSSIGPPAPNLALRPGQDNPTTSLVDSQERNPGSLGWHSVYPVSPPYTDLNSRIAIPHEQPPLSPDGRIPRPTTQLLTPPDDTRVQDSPAHPGRPVTPGQASLFDSLFSQDSNHVVLPYIPESSRRSLVRDSGACEQHITGIKQGQSCGPQFRIKPIENLGDDTDADDAEDAENILVRLLDGLTLDQEVESNNIAFVAQSFASWIYCFDFEPIHAIGPARETIIRGVSLGGEVRERTILIAKTVSAITSSTDYELTYFMMLYQRFMKDVLKARAGSALSREAAVKVVASCRVMVPVASRVASLATLLNLLNMYAPVFRWACAESADELVSLTRVLTTEEASLKYYVSFDILQSVITHRPMFFRYNLEIHSPEDDKLLDAEGGSGLRLSIGLPDRLVFILARINILLEDYGDSIDQEVVRELETAIARLRKPIVSSGPGDTPSHMVGRLMVQESWRLAAHVYLYMGLCRADSSDARVVKIQKQFMRLLETLKPRRNPDAFLILPMAIVGIATSSITDQSTLFARLWGVSECSKSGTLGNDVSRMLNDIWERTANRPAVWSDLRIACSRIIGI